MINESRSENSPDFYVSLFENMLDGLAYCKLLFDAEGQPVDFLYVSVNKNFEILTGLHNAAGKKVSELIPGIQQSNPELFAIYGRVSLGGKPERFETYVEPLGIWFFVSVYSPQKNFFVAIFQNITVQKQKEKELEEANHASQTALIALREEQKKLAEHVAELELLNTSLVGRELKMIELKQEIEELKKR